MSHAASLQMVWVSFTSVLLSLKHSDKSLTTVFGSRLANEPVKFQCLNFHPQLNSTLSKSREDRGPGLPTSAESSLDKIDVHSKHCAIQQ